MKKDKKTKRQKDKKTICDLGYLLEEGKHISLKIYV